MNKNLRALLCLLLSLTLLCSLCACGDEEEEAGETNPTFSWEEFDPEQSYHLSKNTDGTYNLQVVDHTGNAFLFRENLVTQPECKKIGDNLLQITAPTAKAPHLPWAVFCDVSARKVSNTFGNFLAVKGNKVACLENLTDEYHVFVRDMFDESVPPQVVTLTDLQVDKDLNPFQKAELNKEGDLEIVYHTTSGKKTVTIAMK